MDDEIVLDVVVVGAGVIGLATARALARAGRGVQVLEAEPRIGMHTSGRNSEVIHAGIHYPPGSLKARLCVAGRTALYEYAVTRNIAHRRLGKLLVATSVDELPVLSAIEARAVACGVDDLEALDAQAARVLEPHVSCAGALLSPSTGIIDSHGLLAALLADVRALDGDLRCSARVLGGTRTRDGFLLRVEEAGAERPTRVRCRALVNAAGFSAQALSAAIEGLDTQAIPPCYYAKGHYFALRGQCPFSRLVYPVPSAHGLGVHVTLDLAGRARFGPDVAFIEAIDYTFDETRRARFVDAIRRYYPALNGDDLEPAYTGIRPKLGPHGSAAQDFVIRGPEAHGVPALVELFGIESPGLTASLAIGDEVARRLA